MAGEEDGLPHIDAGECFDPQFSHPDITFADNIRTAIFTNLDNDEIQCAIGCNVYHSGEHDIRIRLSYLPNGLIAWIRMTNSPDPPLNKAYPHAGMTGWSVKSPFYVGLKTGLQVEKNLGKPWRTGDLIHLHLECEKHKLSSFHSGTGMGQTICNVTGSQRLFIAMSKLRTEISIHHD